MGYLKTDLDLQSTGTGFFKKYIGLKESKGHSYFLIKLELPLSESDSFTNVLCMKLEVNLNVCKRKQIGNN